MIQNEGNDITDDHEPLIIHLHSEYSRYPAGGHYGSSPHSQQGSIMPYTTQRAPVHYGSFGTKCDDISATLTRYKYYNKLSPHADTKLQMPDHVVPEPFLISIFFPHRTHVQSSVVTIFAMWNTMVGTSLLSMPWAIEESGFATSIVIIILMALLMFYTSYRIIKTVDGLDTESMIIEFSDVCRDYLGRWAEIASFICSIATLLGAAIVYWILMSNFLFNAVVFIYYKVNGGTSSHYVIINTTSENVFCPTRPSETPMQNITPSNSSLDYSDVLYHTSNIHSTFWNVWDGVKTVPFFLIVVVFPLLNFKSPTFFTKFNSFGTISVVYLLVFITVKAGIWGINANFYVHDDLFISEFSPKFASITGISAGALFIHNAVLSIMRNQKNSRNNTRDLALAYVAVTFTYLYTGVVFYITFPTDKHCIAENLLDNILSTDVMAFIARVFLFIQFVTVYPLLMYVLRVQMFSMVFGSVWPSLKHVIALNIFLVACCATFARFLPHIGKVIGFVGAFSGFAYATFLPCLVYMVSLRKKDQLGCIAVLFHTVIIAIGFLNFVAQFVNLGLQ